jgi:hypothetical protein
MKAYAIKVPSLSNERYVDRNKEGNLCYFGENEIGIDNRTRSINQRSRYLAST